MAEHNPGFTLDMWGTGLAARLSRRRVLASGLAAGALGLGSLLAACGGGQQEAEQATRETGGGTPATTPAAPAAGTPTETPRQASGRIVVGRTGDADSLDPHHTIASISWQVFTNYLRPAGLVGRQPAHRGCPGEGVGDLRRRPGVHLLAPRRHQVPRWYRVQRRGREVHLRPDPRSADRCSRRLLDLQPGVHRSLSILSPCGCG